MCDVESAGRQRLSKFGSVVVEGGVCVCQIQIIACHEGCLFKGVTVTDNTIAATTNLRKTLNNPFEFALTGSVSFRPLSANASEDAAIPQSHTHHHAGDSPLDFFVFTPHDPRSESFVKLHK